MAATVTRPTKRPTYRTYYGDTIKTIYAKIVKPAIEKLLVHSEEASFHEGLKRFFHEDTRTVFWAVVLIPFEIPGKEWINQNPADLGYGESSRSVKPGDHVIVRIDTVLEEVEIEYEEAVFTFRIEQYRHIKPKLAMVG
jgi:hypothetical protein